MVFFTLILKALCEKVHKQILTRYALFVDLDSPTVMVDREKTCLSHWFINMHKHIQKLIAKSFYNQHIKLYRKYKDAKSIAKVELIYQDL